MSLSGKQRHQIAHISKYFSHFICTQLWTNNLPASIYKDCSKYFINLSKNYNKTVRDLTIDNNKDISSLINILPKFYNLTILTIHFDVKYAQLLNSVKLQELSLFISPEDLSLLEVPKSLKNYG